MLDAFLAALSGRRMFVTYRLEPKAGGGTNKIPIDAFTGRNIDAQNPQNWLTPEDALATGLPIGIVIYEGCGLFCVDLDKAIVDGAWSPFALNIMGRFPGAAMEISASAIGAHIFGSCKNIPAHRTRRAGQGMEIYTRARFIALTGTSMIGDVLTDHTAALQALIAEYYPEAVIEQSNEWTTTPYEGWRGGGTDDQILQSLRNKQTAAVFGGRASFAQLWDCDEDALASLFPPDGVGKTFNASAADQALANHLAYATGYNCDHVLRLMEREDCQLRREKWEREDYLHRTILKACEKRQALELANASRTAQSIPTAPPADNQTAGLITQPGGAVDVMPAPPPPGLPQPPAALPAPAAARDPDAPPLPGFFIPAATIFTDQQQVLFAGIVHVEDSNVMSMADGTALDKNRFENRFGGVSFQTQVDGSKPTESAWDAYLFGQVHFFPRVASVTFDPRLAPREIIIRDGQRVMNSYIPVHVPAIEGDVTPFLVHLSKMYPYGRDAEILLAYFAAMIQHKGAKFPWAVLLQGVEGNGKTFLSLAMEYCLSQRYTHNAKASQLDSRFNSAFEGKLLIVVEDVHISEGRASAWETLKPMITNTRMEIEGKGVDKVTRDVCFNFIMNSNHKDAIRKTVNDRRIANFFGAQQHKLDLIRDGMGPDYFKRLYDWARDGGFAAIHYYLQHYAIPDDLNPAGSCNRAPETTSTAAAIDLSRGSVEQELQEAIDSGKKGFRDGWVSSFAMDDLLAEIGMGRKITRHRRHDLITEAGFIWHPGLPQGRVMTALPDGSKPRLYVRPDHPTIALKYDTKAICAAFIEAQGVR